MNTKTADFLQKAQIQGQTVSIPELIERLPKGKYNKAHKLAERLNRAGMKPKFSESYSQQIVYDVLALRTTDINVEIALLEWVSEIEGVDKQVKPLLDAAKNIIMSARALLN